MARFIRCAGLTPSGIRCGRAVLAGQTYCNKHIGNAPTGIIAAQAAAKADMSPLQIVRELMDSKDESIRLRASEKYLDMLDREKAAKVEESLDSYKALIPYATVEQANEMIRLVLGWNAITTTLRRYVQVGGTPIPKDIDEHTGQFLEPGTVQPLTVGEPVAPAVPVHVAPELTPEEVARGARYEWDGEQFVLLEAHQELSDEP